MKKVLSFLVLLLMTMPLFMNAQVTHNMPASGTDSVTMCNGYLYDMGGASGTYSNNYDGTTILYPSSTDSVVSISGTYYTESCCDHIYIYDGVGTSGQLLGTYQGQGSISLTSSTGALTIHMTSDVSLSYDGFAFLVTCAVRPACPRPTFVAAGNIQPTALTLSWVDTIASSWNIKYSTSNFNPDTATTLPSLTVTSSSTTISNLNPNTLYYFYVQGNCTGGGNSLWSYVVSYRTDCNYITTLPYVDNLDSTPVSGMPPCWNRYYAGTSSQAYPYVSTSSSSAYNGNNYLYFYSYSSSAYGDEYAIMPPIDETISPLNTIQLSFYYRTSSSYTGVFEVGVMSNPYDPSTFAMLDSIYVTNTTYQPREVLLSNYSGTGRYIAFKQPHNAVALYNYLYIDAITVQTIPACPRPSGVAVTSTTTTTAHVHWVHPTATSYTVEYGPMGFTPGTGTQVTATDTAVDLTNLLPSTRYDVYVIANCTGGDVSPFSFTTTFNTACGEISALPYTENFDSWTTANSTSVNALPLCWNHINTGTSYSSYPIIYNSSSYAYSGTNALSFYAYSTTNYADQYAILPPIDTTLFPINTLQISFQLKSRSTSYNSSVVLGVMTDPSNDSTFVPLHTFSSNLSTFAVQEYQLNNYTGYGNYIALKAPRPTSSYNEPLVDNIQIEAIPDCPRPTAITLSNLNNTQVDVSWSDTNSVSWSIEYGPVGFTHGSSSATTITSATTTVNLSNLTPNTSYDLYVRGVCTTGNFSTWSYVKNFRTACDAITTLPYTENFDSYLTGTTAAINSCWRRGSNYSAGYPYLSSSYASSPGNSMYMYSTSSTYSYVALPLFTEPLSNLTITFKLYVTNNSYPHSIQVGVMSNPEDISSFTLIRTVSPSAVSTWETFMVPFTSYSGTGYIALVSPNGENSYPYLDDISVDLTPDCGTPTALTFSNVRGNSAYVAWSPGEFGTPDFYTLEYTEAGQSNWTSTTVTAPYYMLSNLTPSTTYNVRVKTTCTGNSEGTYATGSFTTANCISGGEVAIGNGTATSTYLPYYNLYNYAYSQQLYFASEFNGPTTLTGMSLYKSSADALARTIVVYLGNTTQSTMTGTTYIPSGLQHQVYSGSFTMNQGWNNITFDSAFVYTGGNLVVTFDDNTGSYTSSHNYLTHTGPTNSLYFYSDTQNPNPALIAATLSTTTARDNIIFHASCDSNATCVAPNVVVSDVTSSSVDLTWAPGMNETSWNIEYRQDTTNTWISEGSTTNTYATISNLNPNTTYYFHVIANCGSENDTALIFATTECGVVSIYPYTEGFEGYTSSTFNPCWYRYTNYTSMSPYVSNSYNNGGTQSLYWYKGTTNYAYVALPAFDLPINQLQVNFDLYKTNTSYPNVIELGVMTDRYDNNTFTLIGSFTPSTVSTWQSFEQSLADYTGNGLYIAFRAPASSSYCYVYMDNVSVQPIPNCSRPIDVTYSNITQTSATVSWTDHTGLNWEIEYGPHGFPLSTGTVVTSTTTSVTLQNLNSSSAYDVYIRAFCASGDTSEYSFVTSFNTQCGTMIIPYSENFDGWTGTTSTNVTALPLCWNKYNAGSSYTGYPIIYNNSTYAYSGTNSLRFYSTTSTSYADQYVIMMPVDATVNPVNTLEVMFLMRYGSGTGKVVVGVMSNPTQISTFVPVDTVTTTSTTYAFYDVPLSSYTGTGTYIALMAPLATTSSYNNPYIDNLKVETIPSCARVSDFHYTDATQSSSISLAWTGNPGAVSYEVIYGLSGFSPATTGTTVTGITDTFTTVNGLTAGVSYDFYIRGNCGSDYSPWCFMPVTASPGSYVMGVTGSDTIHTCGASIYDDGGPNGIYSNYCNFTLVIYPSSQDSLITLSGSHYLESCCDHLIIYDGVGTTGNQLYASSTTSSSLLTFGPVTSTQGPITLVFTSDVSITYAGLHILASCVAAPTCRIPTNVTVSSLNTTDATVTWNGYTNTQWQVVCSTSNAVPDSLAIAGATTVTTNSISFQNLTPATTYYVYVRTDCSTEFSSWSNVLSFTTVCTAATIPVTYSFEADAVGTSAAFPTCWTRINGAGSSYNYYPYVSSSNANTGSNCLYYYCYTSTAYADNAYAVLPYFDATANPVNTLQLDFYGRANSIGSSYNSRVIVGLMTSPNNANSFVAIDTIDFTSITYQNAIVPFSGYSGTNTYVALKFPKPVSPAYYNYCYLDDITLEVIPTCPKPISVSAVSGADNVQLNWTEYGSATSWNIIYGPTGFDPTTSGTTINGVTTHPYTITGLSADTLYDFYVRSICSASDISNWSLHTSSQPGQYLVPTTGTDSIHVCSGHIFDSGGPNGQYDNDQDGYLVVYPSTANALIHLTGSYTTESVTYDWIDVYDGVGSTGTSLAHVGGSGTLDVQSTTGPLTLRFRTDVSGVYDGFNLAVSCVNDTSAIICDAPTALTASPNITSAVLSWTGTGNFEVSYKTTTSSAWSANTAVTGSTTTITGLTAATAYDWRVRKVCDISTTSDWATGSFTTNAEASCPMPTNLHVIDSTNTTATLAWDQVTGTASSWILNYRIANGTWTTTTVSSTSYTIVNLIANTTYQAQVQAICDATNSSDFTPIISFTTTNVGINDYILANSINLYPNPTANYIDVRVNNTNIKVSEMRVYDVYGKLLQIIVVNDNPTRIDVSKLAEGMYFVRVISDKGIANKSFIKK